MMASREDPFEPTLNSLRTHVIPEWFEDAKFGIFVHWGLFSVPAFAPSLGSIGEVFASYYDIAVAQTPYAEWYENAIKIPESDSARYHATTYGNAPYENFRAPFLEALAQWDARGWARIFAEAGARYVVFVTKHCDGYSLWPTTVAHPRKAEWHSPRDIVGELAEAVRAQGMRFGVYYCGGMDWSFNPEPLRTLGEFLGSVPVGAYPDYAAAQVAELTERYKPSVLWNDVAWPQSARGMMKVIARYYNAVPDGVVNDRWIAASWKTRLMRLKVVRQLFDRRAKAIMRRRAGKGIIPPPPLHFDFRTPEYTTFPEIQVTKWEATRGMSHSFGYNRRDTDKDYLSVVEIVHDLVDVVSKNGNLLLNVGPRGEDAQIPLQQVARLKGLGSWLKVNGEAIYGTRPWSHAQTLTTDGLQVRFTHKGTTLYAIVLGSLQTGHVELCNLALPEGVNIELLGVGPVAWRREGANTVVSLPQDLATSPACVFAISPIRSATG